MKKIFDICNNNEKTTYVKLRLRGKDSGHKDINTGIKKETSEPLHLCISSKTEDR